jgi:hypothetical protein
LKPSKTHRTVFAHGSFEEENTDTDRTDRLVE